MAIVLAFALIMMAPAMAEDEDLGSSPWPSFHGDERNSGLSQYDTSGTTGEIDWIFNSSDYLDSNPTLGPHGEIYVLGSRGWGTEGYLYSILPNGTLNWKSHIYGDVKIYNMAPVVGNGGDVFVNLPLDAFVCMDPNGTEKWRFEGRISSCDSPTIGPDGTIYVTSGSYEDLYAFDPNGSLLWECDYSLDSHSTPAVAEDGTIYVAGEENWDGPYHHRLFLYAILPNGTVSWKSPITDDQYEYDVPTPAIGSDGSIYFCDRSGTFYCLRDNGSMRWTLEIPSVGPLT